MRMNDITMRIMEMGLIETYRWIINTPEAPERIRNIGRWGNLDSPIDIHDFINNNITQKRKSGIVLYRGRPFSSSEFWNDMEKRETKMKEWLLKHYAPEKLSSPRKVQEESEEK